MVRMHCTSVMQGPQTLVGSEPSSRSAAAVQYKNSKGSPSAEDPTTSDVRQPICMPEGQRL